MKLYLKEDEKSEFIVKYPDGRIKIQDLSVKAAVLETQIALEEMYKERM